MRDRIRRMKEPEKYRSLVVRVTGYSAYFVTLDRQSQDALILVAGERGAVGGTR